MANQVETLPHFDRLFKRLHKKYPSLLDDLSDLIHLLESECRQGEDLGSGFFKIRLKSRSKNTGKSGGFRVISYLVFPDEQGTTVYLVEIYDKSEYDTVDKKALQKLVKEVGRLE